MIDGIGNGGSLARLEAQRLSGAQRGQQAAQAGAVTTGAAAAVSSTAAGIAQAGAPVDSDKVAAIRAAIAGGSYAVDADAIADRMIALDMPERLA